MRSVLGFFVSGLIAVIGCGGDDDDVERNGSPACQDFQDGVCDYAADRCGVIGRTECDANLAGVVCTSDALASSCTNGLNAATCGQPVAECDLLQIIDGKPATVACQQLFASVCQHLLKCGQTPSLEACMGETASSGVDCSQAIVVDPRFEDCLKQIDGALCTAATPDVCRGAIRVLPAGVTGAMQ